jgi:hypothetical protein
LDSSVSSRRYDAGPVFVDQTPRVSHTFQVKNESNSPLTIKEVRRSCVCTSATISKQVLAPGEAATLTMDVDVKPIFHEWTVSCNLVTDQGDRPERDYVLTYRSYPRTRFEAETITLECGTSGENQYSRAAFLEIYEPAGSEPDVLLSVEGGGSLTTAFDPTPIIDLIDEGRVRRSRYRVSVSLPPSYRASSGTHTETITAMTRRGYSASSVASWTYSAPVSITPPSTSFGIIDDAGPPRTRKVIIKSSDGTPFRLIAADTPAGPVELQGVPSDGPSSIHVVTLLLHPASEQGRFRSGQREIPTDHPDMPVIPIEWSAICKATRAPHETTETRGNGGKVSDTAGRSESP